MAYLQSDDISVFPATRRTYESSYARQVTEASLVGIVNKLIDRDGFVVNKTLPTTQGAKLYFNIHGYYFEAEPGDIIDLFNSNVENIYAVIELSTGVDASPFIELVGQDEEESDISIYKGIEFVNSQPAAASNRYSLHLLQKTGEGWIIPEDSIVKFSPESLDITLIDGGIITDNSSQTPNS